MAIPDWTRDEYDSYLGPTLRLLENGASQQEIAEYLATVELGRMGLSETPKARLRRNNFAAELRSWYEGKWQGTSV